MSHDHKAENERQFKATDGDRATEHPTDDRNPETEPTPTTEDEQSSFHRAKEIIRDATKDVHGTFGHHHS